MVTCLSVPVYGPFPSVSFPLCLSPAPYPSHLRQQPGHLLQPSSTAARPAARRLACPSSAGIPFSAPLAPPRHLHQLCRVPPWQLRGRIRRGGVCRVARAAIYRSSSTSSCPLRSQCRRRPWSLGHNSPSSGSPGSRSNPMDASPPQSRGTPPPYPVRGRGDWIWATAVCKETRGGVVRQRGASVSGLATTSQASRSDARSVREG
ncbi:hypothetical protein BRADI_1g53823v3 [Brachypodium distachyon]|uniref:Uncharacterized protein n=1 Tax=Brachypodium distachyon TaxID=15368 RepID=A0A2K2DRA7_BRADI|nr:hypothetical protein BRADI_1g53823v3 [Brachypodium distachyon]